MFAPGEAFMSGLPLIDPEVTIRGHPQIVALVTLLKSKDTFRHWKHPGLPLIQSYLQRLSLVNYNELRVVTTVACLVLSHIVDEPEVFDCSFIASFTRDCVRACAEQLSQVVLQERKDVDDKVLHNLVSIVGWAASVVYHKKFSFAQQFVISSRDENDILTALCGVTESQFGTLADNLKRQGEEEDSLDTDVGLYSVTSIRKDLSKRLQAADVSVPEATQTSFEALLESIKEILGACNILHTICQCLLTGIDWSSNAGACSQEKVAYLLVLMKALRLSVLLESSEKEEILPEIRGILIEAICGLQLELGDFRLKNPSAILVIEESLLTIKHLEQSFPTKARGIVSEAIENLFKRAEGVQEDRGMVPASKAKVVASTLTALFYTLKFIYEAMLPSASSILAIHPELQRLCKILSYALGSLEEDEAGCLEEITDSNYSAEGLGRLDDSNLEPSSLWFLSETTDEFAETSEDEGRFLAQEKLTDTASVGVRSTVKFKSALHEIWARAVHYGMKALGEGLTLLASYEEENELSTSEIPELLSTILLKLDSFDGDNRDSIQAELLRVIEPLSETSTLLASEIVNSIFFHVISGMKPTRLAGSMVCKVVVSLVELNKTSHLRAIWLKLLQHMRALTDAEPEEVLRDQSFMDSKLLSPLIYGLHFLDEDSIGLIFQSYKDFMAEIQRSFTRGWEGILLTTLAVVEYIVSAKRGMLESGCLEVVRFSMDFPNGDDGKRSERASIVSFVTENDQYSEIEDVIGNWVSPSQMERPFDVQKSLIRPDKVEGLTTILQGFLGQLTRVKYTQHDEQGQAVAVLRRALHARALALKICWRMTLRISVLRGSGLAESDLQLDSQELSTPYALKVATNIMMSVRHCVMFENGSTTEQVAHLRKMMSELGAQVFELCRVWGQILQNSSNKDAPLEVVLMYGTAHSLLRHCLRQPHKDLESMSSISMATSAESAPDTKDLQFFPLVLNTVHAETKKTLIADFFKLLKYQADIIISEVLTRVSVKEAWRNSGHLRGNLIIGMEQSSTPKLIATSTELQDSEPLSEVFESCIANVYVHARFSSSSTCLNDRLLMDSTRIFAESLLTVLTSLINQSNGLHVLDVLLDVFSLKEVGDFLSRWCLICGQIQLQDQFALLFQSILPTIPVGDFASLAKFRNITWIIQSLASMKNPDSDLDSILLSVSTWAENFAKLAPQTTQTDISHSNLIDLFPDTGLDFLQSLCNMSDGPIRAEKTISTVKSFCDLCSRDQFNFLVKGKSFQPLRTAKALMGMITPECSSLSQESMETLIETVKWLLQVAETVEEESDQGTHASSAFKRLEEALFNVLQVFPRRLADDLFMSVCLFALKRSTFVRFISSIRGAILKDLESESLTGDLQLVRVVLQSFTSILLCFHNHVHEPGNDKSNDEDGGKVDGLNKEKQAETPASPADTSFLSNLPKSIPFRRQQILGDRITSHKRHVDGSVPVCTYVQSGSNFMEQHWYYCYTCGLTDSKGVCTSCAKVCHDNHDVAYSRFSNFFCDCGAGELKNKPCLCVKANSQSSTIKRFICKGNGCEFADLKWILCPSSDTTSTESRSKSTGVLREAIEAFVKLGGEKAEEEIYLELQETSVAILRRLLSTYKPPSSLNLFDQVGKGSLSCAGANHFFDSLTTLRISHTTSKIKSDPSEKRDISSECASGVLLKRKLSISANQELIAIADSESVSICATDAFVQSNESFGQLQKVKQICTESFSFEVVHVSFHPSDPDVLVVAGWKDCEFLQFNGQRDVVDRSLVKVTSSRSGLRSGIRILDWATLDNSESLLMVTTASEVSFFDLSSSLDQALFTIAFPDHESLKDVVNIQASSSAGHLLALTLEGRLYSSKWETRSSGILYAQTHVEMPSDFPTVRIVSMMYCTSMSAVVLSMENGSIVLCEMDPSFQSANSIRVVEGIPGQYTGDSGNLRFLVDRKPGDGMVFLWCAESANLLAVNFATCNQFDVVRKADQRGSRIDGFATFRDSGGLKVILCDENGRVESYTLRQSIPLLIANPLQPLAVHDSSCGEGTRRKYGGNDEVVCTLAKPIGFFEDKKNITSAVTISGEFDRVPSQRSSSSTVSQDGDYFEGMISSDKEYFEIHLEFSSHDSALAGCRMHVGSSGKQTIPAYIEVGRDKKYLKQVTRWHDIPFGPDVIASQPSKVTIRVGYRVNRSSSVRVDAIHAYSQELRRPSNTQMYPLPAETKTSSCSCGIPGSSPAYSTLHLGSSLLWLSQEFRTRSGLLHEDEEIGAILAVCRQLLGQFDSPDAARSASRTIQLLGKTLSRDPSADSSKPSSSLIGSISEILKALASRTETKGFQDIIGIQHYEHLLVLLSEELRSGLITRNQMDARAIVSFAWSLYSKYIRIPSMPYSLRVSITFGNIDCLYEIARWCTKADQGVLPQATDRMVDLLQLDPEKLSFMSSSRLIVLLSGFGLSQLSSVASGGALLSKAKAEGSSSRANASQDRVQEAVPEHQSIPEEFHYRCDGCDACPMVGNRWHCADCEDFDLCSECYTEGKTDLAGNHKPYHRMNEVNDAAPTDHAAVVDMSAELIQSHFLQSFCAKFPSVLKQDDTQIFGLMQAVFFATIALSRKTLASEVFGKVIEALLLPISCAPDDLLSNTAYVDKLTLALMTLRLLVRTWKDKSPSVKVLGSEHLLKVPKQNANSFLGELKSYMLQSGLQEFLIKIIPPLSDLVLKQCLAKKSQAANNCRGFGSLLVKRRQFTLNAFTPYLTDSYIESRCESPFEDRHALLLEYALRLSYNLIGFNGGQKLDEKTRARWSSLVMPLSELWCQPATKLFKTYIQRLFSKLQGDDESANRFCDFCVFDKALDSLRKWSSEEPSFETNTQAIKVFQQIYDCVKERPGNWQKYFETQKPGSRRKYFYTLFNTDVWKLVDSIDKTIVFVELFSFAVGKLDKNQADSSGHKSSSTDESPKARPPSSAPSAFWSLLLMEQQLFISWMEYFAILHRDHSVRAQSCSLLSYLWKKGSTELKLATCKEIITLIPLAAKCGARSKEFLDVLFTFIDSISTESDLEASSAALNDLGILLLKTIKTCQSFVTKSPNARVYSAIQTLSGLNGHYFEKSPCLICAPVGNKVAVSKLDTLKSEVKYTASAVLACLQECQTVYEVRVDIHEPKMSRCIKTASVYINCDPKSTLHQLKANKEAWTRLATETVTPMAKELVFELPFPVQAKAVMIEIDDCYENYQVKSLEELQCPRCSRLVTDRHGVCRNCRENAYQCRHCRNINYESLDGFLCNECGYSRFCRLDISVKSYKSIMVPKIRNDQDMTDCLTSIETEFERCSKAVRDLDHLRSSIIDSLNFQAPSPGSNEDSDGNALSEGASGVDDKERAGATRKLMLSRLSAVYDTECREAYTRLTSSTLSIAELRKSLCRHLKRQQQSTSASAHETDALYEDSLCLRCSEAFVQKGLSLLVKLSYKSSIVQNSLRSEGVVIFLFDSCLYGNVSEMAHQLICELVHGDQTSSRQICSRIFDRIDTCLAHRASLDLSSSTMEEMNLLTKLSSNLSERGGSCTWEVALRTVFQILLCAVNVSANDSGIADSLLLPCVRILSTAIGAIDSFVEDTDKLSPSYADDENDMGIDFEKWKEGKQSYQDFKRGEKPAPVDDEYVLSRKYGLRWMARTFSSEGLDINCWVRSCVLSRSSASLREETMKLVLHQSSRTRAAMFDFMDLFQGLLLEACQSSQCGSQLFQCVYHLLRRSYSLRAYSVVRKLHLAVLSALEKLIEKCVAYESSVRSGRYDDQHIELEGGEIIASISEILELLLTDDSIRDLFIRKGLLQRVVKANVTLKSLITLRSKSMLLSSKRLKNCTLLLRDHQSSVLSSAHEEFIGTCISLADSSHENAIQPQIREIALDELISYVEPKKPEVSFRVLLCKSPTQEEFIRGNMGRRPYSNKDAGPLMRDVKNMICQRLELHGLLEDDFGMELLVCNKIVSLNLPLDKVYEQIWLKSRGSSTRDEAPMIVVYRLQGLDGDATEPIVDSLDEAPKDVEDPEEKYKVTRAIAEQDGLDLLLNISSGIASATDTAQNMALHLLEVCCKVRMNRVKLLRDNSLTLIAREAARGLREERAQGNGVKRETTSYLNLLEGLVEEACIRTFNGEYLYETIEAVPITEFLDYLWISMDTSPVSQVSERVASVASLLPPLTFGRPLVMDTLCQRLCAPSCLDFRQYDQASSGEENYSGIISFIGTVVGGIASEYRFSSALKSAFLRAGAVDIAAKYVVDVLKPVDGEKIVRTSSAWTSGLKKPGIPRALELLLGLAKNHSDSQKQIINVHSFLQIVHALEGTSSEDGMIGTLAEDLLDVIEQGEGEDLVRNLRNERKRDMKERARLQREAAMKALMGSTSSQLLLEPDVESKQDAHHEDEDEYQCIVCKEGYIDQPELILGVYCEIAKKRHSHRICLAATTTSHPQEYFLISLFRPVHFACHEAARRADSNLRVPKREWDGAALRNSLSPCNIIFPIYHPNLAKDVYLSSISVYWEKRATFTPRSRLSRCHVLLGDIEYLVVNEIATRFRCREPNRDQEYSSPLMSCVQMLCGLVQMGRAMLSDSDVGFVDSNRAYQETLGRLMGQPPNSEPVTDEDVAFVAIASLVFGTALEWTSVIRARLETSLVALRNADKLRMKPEEAEASLVEIIELIHDALDKCGDQYEDILMLVNAACSQVHV